MSNDLVLLADATGWIAVDKPAGVPVVRERHGEAETLHDRAVREVGCLLFLVHRLDRDTSGAILFARSPEVQREISAAFLEGRVRKEYRALVHGVPDDDSGRIDAPVAEGRKGRMRVAPGGKPSATRWRVLERFARHAWLECAPETGRTHQIRVHLAHLGFPIEGDPLYGSRDAESPVTPRLALHARAIEFPLAAGWQRVEAPDPADLRTALDTLRKP